MNETTGLREAIDRLAEFGAATPAVVYPGKEDSGEPFVVVPQGMKVRSLAGLLDPTRIRQSVMLIDAGSFADYVNRFKTDCTMIFANVTEQSAKFVAVMDYHGKAPELKPGRCEHVATFETIQTPEWKAWLAANRVDMDQVKFATWLEDNLKLLVEPTGAELLELVKSLHGHANARFNTALRLETGAYSVSYEEDVQIRGSSTTKSEAMELPPTIKAGIAPFLGAERYELTARLKSRVSERKLMLRFETIALHEIVRDSVLLLVRVISEKTGIVPLQGGNLAQPKAADEFDD